MDETQTQETVPEMTDAALRSEARKEEKQPASGMEINLGELAASNLNRNSEKG